MALYKVILAYDGSRFAGYQRQTRGGQPVRTVQGEFEAALRRLGWGGEKILSAGRTDTGVHASGQAVSFELEWTHPAAELLAALNAHLPDDMAARSVELAPPGFHPRYSALARRYRYRIYSQPVRDPLRDRYAWRLNPGPDLKLLNAAAALLPGEHDFAGFGSPLRVNGSTVRTVHLAQWTAVGEDELAFEIQANAFLYRMVRRLVFAQAAVGQGRLALEDFQARVAGDLMQGQSLGIAPACGLELVEVFY